MKSNTQLHLINGGLILLFLLICPALNMAQTIDEPPIEWTAIDWAPHTPTGTAQAQDDSGEDWWYNHSNVYDASDNHIGYITCGYATWVNFDETETNGCLDCEDGSAGVDCEEFETTSRYKGCARGTIARYDLNGNMLWCKPFYNGAFFKIVQTKDKDGFVAIGDTKATEKKGGGWLAYNIDSGNQNNPDDFSDCNNYTGGGESKAIVVKVDNDGNLDWGHLYGYEDYTGTGENAYTLDSRGFGIVVKPNGDYIAVGRAFDDSESKDKIFTFEIDEDGLLNWKQIYGTSNFTSQGYAIARDPGTDKYAISGNQYKNNLSSVAKARAFAMLFPSSWDDTSSPTWTRIIEDNINDDKHGHATDIDFDHDGNVLLPAMIDWSRTPVEHDILAEGRVYTLDPTDGTNVKTANYVDLGDIRAWDLKVGITPTDDDGFAIVTSKLYGSELDENSSELSGLVPDSPNGIESATNCPAYAFQIWNTDTYIAKYVEATGGEWDLEWETNFDTPTPRGNWPGDIKKQECLYEITQTGDGGYVITGNTSDNFDDDYLVKLYDDCQMRITDWFYQAEPDSVVLNSNSTWTTADRKIKGKIIVPDNITLTIDGITVEFADSRRTGMQTYIRVEEGGKLVIKNGAVLTSVESCGSSMWDGVQVWGRPNHKQDAGIGAGEVEIRGNSIIENARIGLYAGVVNYDSNNKMKPAHNKGGAVVDIDQAKFINNRRDIYMNPYPYSRVYPQFNESRIKECQFICDDHLNDPAYSLNDGTRIGTMIHLGVWDVHGLNMYSNKFIGTSQFPLAERGIGISSLNASYVANCWGMTSGGCTPYETSFDTLYYGISGSATDVAAAMRINACSFTQCHYGAFLKNIQYPDITRNTFNVGVDGNTGDHGLYMMDCSKYLVEGNDFVDAGDGNVGINILSYQQTAQNYTNEVYRNDFDGLTFAVFGGGHNSNLNSDERGLKVKCNDLDNDRFDVITTIPPGISTRQGWNIDDRSPAGNQFDGCAATNGELYNLGNYYDYFHHANGGGQTFAPASTCYNSTGVNPINTTLTFDSSCPSNFKPANQRMMERRTEFNFTDSVHTASLSKYNDSIDGGDTQNLLDLVSNDEDSATINTDFGAASPYVSDQALLALINDKETPMPAYSLGQIIIANSPVTDTVMSALENRDPSIPTAVMDSIDSAQTGLSDRFLLEGEVSLALENRSLALDELIRAFIHEDSLTGYLDSIALYLEQETTLTAMADLVSIRLWQKQFLQADTLLDSLDNVDEWKGYAEVQSTLRDWYSAGVNIDSICLDTNLQSDFDSLAVDSVGFGSIPARAINEWFCFDTIYPVIVYPDTSGASKTGQIFNPEQEEDKDIANKPTSLRNYPNPYRDQTIIEVWTATQGELVIYDLQGRPLKRYQVLEGESRIIVQSDDLGPGIYLYVLSVEGKKEAFGKMIHLR